MLKTAAEMIKEAQQHIECVDVATAKKIYEDDPDAIIVDVREAHNANESKLSESVNISRGLLEMKIHQVCPQASTAILTHCGGGGRASLAAHTLQQLGYQNVYAITAPYDEIKESFDQESVGFREP
jgi:phage shock protein E